MKSWVWSGKVIAMKMKAIQLLLNSVLPVELRDYNRELDAKSINNLLVKVARDYPDKYESIAKSITDLGRKASYLQGETLTLSDTAPVLDRDKILASMDQEIEEAKLKYPDKDKFGEARAKIWTKYADILKTETAKAALSRGNNLAYSVVSGARGSPDQLKMMVTTPAIYTDAKDRIVPLFVRHSFADGLRPAEYLAGTYGARKAVIATKVATAKGGDLCLAGDTRVRMADGTVLPISAIKPGDMVFGADKDGMIKPVRVVKKFDQGIRDIVEVKLPSTPGSKNHHTYIRCTKDHKFLVRNGDAAMGYSTDVVPIKELTNRMRLLQVRGGEVGSASCARLAEKVAEAEESEDLSQSIWLWDNESFFAFLGAYFKRHGAINKKTDSKDEHAVYLKFTSYNLRKLETIRQQLQIRAGIFGAGIRLDGKYTHRYTWDINKQSECTRFLNLIPKLDGEMREKQEMFLTDFEDLPYPGANRRMVEIREVGRAECYDIEVDHPDHLFVLANGYITSNSKQLVQASTPLLISENDCGVRNGIDLEVDDNSLKGRLLAVDTAGLPAGTVLDRTALAHLKKKGQKKIVARSAMTCQAKTGVCSKCIGLNAEGKFPSKGEAIGITAAQSVGEPICVEGNTLVRMADWSLRKIKEIKPGEYVLGSDMEGNLTPTRVVDVFHNGPRPCVETFVRKGRGKNSEVISMVTTREHKTLCWSNLRNEPHIRPIGKDCYRLGVHLSKGVKTNKGKHEPWAAFLGLMTGDGSYTGRNVSRNVTLACHEPETEKWASDFLKPHGMRLSRMASGEFRVSMVDQTSDMQYSTEGVLVRNTLKRVLQEKKMWGQRSVNKTLPADINEWDNGSIAAFIGGYLAADGWVTGEKGVIGFSSISRKLVAGIKDLLELRFGIYSTRLIAKRKKKGDGTYYAPSYEFCIACKADIREFERVISIPGIKQKRLSEAVKNHKRYDKEPQRGRFTVVDQVDVGIQDTWDIEVDNATHLFALHNSLIVSNTQNALNTKHSGGVAGGKREYSGFNYINQFVQTPSEFPDRATLAREDGKVTKVEEAPQGGFYVTVNDKTHYIAPGYNVTVKPGDTIEAGEALSEGLIDPGEVVELRGLGEGRRYYSDRLKRLLDDSGMYADRRNLEVIARANLDHLQIEDADEDDPYLPDDVVSYSTIQRYHRPPKDTRAMEAKAAVGKYLQSPALHYTIGTRITPKIAERLNETGFNQIQVSDNSPQFKPHMVRLRSAAHNNPDWLASMHTSYLKKQLNEAAVRGEDTNVKQNPHFAPRLAIGEGFGDDIEETGQF